VTERLKRDIKIIAGPLTIEPRTATGENQPMLKVRFDITKTNNREPNKAELTIWNLKEANRVKLQEEGLEVIIEAGYVDAIDQIFKGDIETTTVGKDSVNWITSLELGDGSKQMRTARSNDSFRGPQTPGEMLKKAAKPFLDLGIGEGNLIEKVKAGVGPSVLKELINTYVLSGKTSDVLDDIASAMGLNYSVQDKSLQFLGKGEALQGAAILLDLTNGLIGSPDIGEKGVVSAVSLLNGQFKPGVQILLSSRVISGTYVAQKVQHVGDSWADEWNTNLELKPI
jgi:hypothetical protein